MGEMMLKQAARLRCNRRLPPLLWSTKILFVRKIKAISACIEV
jgi:hypothetical protein